VIAQLLALSLIASADPAVTATIHTGHFEKNSSGLKGDASFLMFTDFAAFEKVLGTTPPVGVRRPNPMTEAGFKDVLVAVVIKRGKAVTTYSEVTAVADGTTLTLKYKADAGTPGTATFASPLVVGVPRGKLTKVVFVENGKEVGTTR
jgi:hypothetical protein